MNKSRRCAGVVRSRCGLDPVVLIDSLATIRAHQGTPGEVENAMSA
jgi:hypothetical protein